MTKRGLIVLLISLLHRYTIASGWSIEKKSDKEIEFLSRQFFQWIRERDGGYISDKLEYRKLKQKNTEFYGLFAKETIKENELLMKIPSQIYLGEEDANDENADISCKTVSAVVKEMKKGKHSFYAPYLALLKSSYYAQPRSVPSGWSRHGKIALLQLLGNNKKATQTPLPPLHPFDWIEVIWREDCNGDIRDNLKVDAALLVLQRGGGGILIPGTDLMRHRNGPALNTKTIQSIKSSTVVTTQKIKRNQEIFTSYCPACFLESKEIGTFEYFHDRGFIEEYPQRWIFSSSLGFDIFQVENSDQLQLDWIINSDDTKSISYLSYHYKRLQSLDMKELKIVFRDLPDYEYSLIVQLRDALSTSIALAIKNLKCQQDNSLCDSSLVHYDSLEKKPDPLDYYSSTCDMSKFYNDTHWYGYFLADTFQSHYQSCEFWHEPINKTTTLELDRTIQTTSAYRPHYHEMFVHYATRYMPTIKRAVFVGGGDSMLLHELLKYKNIELIVGLEIDQFVVRKTFKNLGVQPHFDLDHVEWWFGDAAKTLNVLPKEYFGTFDLVLVDMSETPAADSVTEHLTIWDSLALLLNQDGIYVKNEYYIEQLSQFFDYTVQVYYHKVPSVCSQGFAFASNTIDFMHADLFHHDIYNLYIRNVTKENRFEHIHDYRRYSGNEQRYCQDSFQPKAITTQKSTAGILMIVEAEQITISDDLLELSTTATIQQYLTDAIIEENIKIISLVSFSGEQKKATITIILREGYIVARFWPHDHFCALDIHFWSSFEKQPKIKKALLKAMESASPSSYRIVVGGMFGVTSWKEDEFNRGPRITHFCNDESSAAASTTSASIKNTGIDITNIALSESVTGIVRSISANLLVLCGEDLQSCSSLEVLKNISRAHKIIPLTICPDLPRADQCSSSFQSYQKCVLAESSSQKMLECEQMLLKKILKVFSNSDKVDAIILDPIASKEIAQIILRIFKNRKILNQLTYQKNLSVIAIVDNDWKKNWLERFRTDVLIYDPVFRIEIQFDNSIELGITSLELEQNFVKKTLEAKSSIESKTGVSAKIKSLLGGQWNFQNEFNPDYFAVPSDYDQSDALKQYKEQVPKGYQTIFQLKISEEQITSLQLKVVLRSSLIDMSIIVANDGISKIHIYDNLGEGTLLVFAFSRGNVIFVWNGRLHIDVNLFTYEEDIPFHEEFIKSTISNLEMKFNIDSQIVLRDEQPRGFGRVVNTKADKSTVPFPRWADELHE